MQARRLTRLGRIAVAVAAWGAAAMAGCALRTPEDPGRPSYVAKAVGAGGTGGRIDWPLRYPELLLGGPEEQQPERCAELLSLDDERLGQKLGLSLEGRDLGRYGEGVLHEIKPTHPGQTMWSGRPVRFSTLYLFRSGQVPRDELNERVARVGADKAVAGAGHASFLALYEPEPPGLAPRGLVVHLTGLIGVGPERPVLREMRRRGWAVLVVPPPTNDLVDFAGMVVQRRSDLLSMEVRGAGIATGARLSREEAAERVAQDLARGVDDYLAQWAYAVEAVLAHLAEHRPDIPRRPLAVVGYSLGAIALPAVVVRNSDAFDAAVLVTGGADLLRISRRTSLSGFGISVVRAGEPLAPEEWEAVHRGYLAATELDPYRAAAALVGRPVLMLHGVFDTIVPASAGNLLYERLGRPERWSYFGGHAMVFWLLPTQARRIADWLDGAVWRVGREAGTRAGQGETPVSASAARPAP